MHMDSYKVTIYMHHMMLSDIIVILMMIFDACRSQQHPQGLRRVIIKEWIKTIGVLSYFQGLQAEDLKRQRQNQGLCQGTEAGDARHQPLYREVLLVLVEGVPQKLLHHLSKGL